MDFSRFFQLNQTVAGEEIILLNEAIALALEGLGQLITKGLLKSLFGDWTHLWYKANC